MVGAAHLVQDQVPVQENVHTLIQISDDVMGILLRVRQMILRAVSAEFDARFGQQKLLLREAFPDHTERFKVIAAIPMECNAGNHVVCLCIDDGLRPFKGPFFVVIPDIDFDVIQAVRSERWPDIVPQECLFLLSRVNAGIPCLNGLWLILECQHRHMEATFPILLDVSADVFCPAFPITFFEFSAVISFPVGLHVSRRTPGGQHDFQLAVIRLFRILQHREDILLDPLKGKAFKLCIVFIPVCLVMAK